MTFLFGRSQWCALIGLLSFSALIGCSSGPTVKEGPALPPAPRLVPPPSWNLCDRREAVLMHEAGHRTERTAWGIGEKVVVYGTMAGRESEYHLFFDDRGVMAGYIGILYAGVDLASQQAYATWISKQVATEFLLPPAITQRLGGANSGRLYMDQGDRISGRAIVVLQGGRQFLYIDSNVLTAYGPLLTPYKPEYLGQIHLPAATVSGGRFGPYESESRDYIARQQFAKGEIAHFALCGDTEMDIAVEAYKRAIAIGLSEPLYQAEAYHRLGLAYRDKGLLKEATGAMETSLKLRPSIPEVVNHLGKVYAMMGDTTRAIEAFHKAIGLKPNYAIAHFNLAEVIEATQPRRALTAYENYLAYVDPKPAERERIAKAKERVLALEKAGK
jgi:tetratricopeptide (TPR) repeat protein